MERLSVDFAGETKLTCRDCLRSKAMPCPQVQTLLEDLQQQRPQQQQQQQYGTTSHHKYMISINAGVLTEAQALMKQILGVSGSTALFQINKMATAIRFLQLLLSLPHKTPLHQQQHQQQSNNAAPTTDAAISVDRLDQLIQESVTDLVQAVSQLQTAWAQNRRMSGSDNDGETRVVDVLTMDTSQTHSDCRPVACFVFVSILRLQVFGKRRQQWMIPLCRALCDLALASNLMQAPLPTSLVEDAIRSMNQLLEEGCILLTNDAVSRWMSSEKGCVSETQETLLDLSHHSFFTKFLSFLVARIASILPLLRDSESSSSTTPSVFSSSCRMLTLLRGLPWLLTHLDRTHRGRPVADAEACLRNHGDMADKLEKQLLKVLWNKKATEDRIHSSLLTALLDEKVKRKSASTPLQDLIRRGRIWGRALLLQKLLARVNDETFVNDGLTRDAELLLKLCEIYHAVVLPECFGILATASFDDGSDHQNEEAHNLIVAPLQHMTTLLIRVENSMMATHASKCAQLHRLLLRWLAGFSPITSSPSSGHPLTTQFVSSLIYLYSMNGCDEKQTPALTSLMIKVLFDARTKTAFRRNIAGVLRRMLASTRQLSTMVGSLVETEFARVWKEEDSNLQKKRKRKKSNRSSIIGAYRMGDVEVIGDILATLRCHASSLLRETVKSFIEGGRFSRTDELNNKTHVKSISLLIRYIEGAISESISTSGWLSDSERSTVLQQLVELALAELSEGGSKRDIHLPLLLSIMSIFRVACAHAIPSFPLKSLCQLLTLCTHANRSPGHAPLLLESTGMLGFLADSISESCSKEILESIRSIFIQTLSSQDLIVVRLALGSLVRFGHRLHERHASLLPTFLPANRVPMFQARAQGLVWTLSGTCKVRMDLEHFETFGRSLETLVHPRRLERSIFPILNSFHISCGSFYLQMPTKDGRQAIVLFPPGEQSLEDIRHMYELQDGEDLPNVQVLQRVALRGGEGGCKFVLEPRR